MTDYDSARLRELLDQHFSEEEMRTLCFDMGLDYDNLPGRDKGSQARELVAFCARHGTVDDLVRRLSAARPRVAWVGVSGAATHDEARGATYNATVSGSGASAQGPGATAVGAGGVSIGGNVERSQIVSGNDNVTGGGEAQRGIRVGRIEGAQKVTIGADVQGGSAADAAALAQALLDGSISVDEVLNSGDVAVGLRYVSDARHPTGEELRKEIAELRAQLDAALRQGEIADRGAAEDAVDDLDSAGAELEKAEPDGGRVLRRLRHVAEILVETNKVTDAAKGVASTVAKLAPYAAAIAQLAATYFGR